MSSKIYFTNKQQKHWSWWLIRAFTLPLLLIPNSWSNAIVAKLLLKPVKRRLIALPNNIGQEFMDTPCGQVSLYRVGQGPMVLLSHGWSGAASQLFELMQSIADRGYQAVAFDHIGHGASETQLANLFLFIKTKRHMIQMLEQQGEVAAIISHSMGATATINALDKVYPTLLIAPVFEFSKALFDKVQQSGLPRQLLVDLLAELEDRHQMNFASCDPKLHIPKHANSVYIIHDENDKFSPIHDSIKIMNQHPHISLIKTQNLGHGKIIGATKTLELFDAMMQRAETTGKPLTV